MTGNLIVNRGVKVAVLTLAGLGAGCVGLNIAGFPLGPQQEGGMEITGAIAPQVAANSCVFNPGGPSIVEPIVELGTQGTRANRYRAVFGVFNTRGEYLCKAVVSKRARPGVVNGLGVWWRKLGLNGTNVNEVTSQKLTDLGRAPVFYDCLVEVAGL